MQPNKNKLERTWKETALRYSQWRISCHPEYRDRFEHFLSEIKEKISHSPHYRHPKCFISYAWMNIQRYQHERWTFIFIQTLAEHLEKAGVQVFFDRHCSRFGTNPEWFMDHIDIADTVLLMCTRTLRHKTSAHPKAEIHYEIKKILEREARLLEGSHMKEKNRLPWIIPIIISGHQKNATPRFIYKCPHKKLEKYTIENWVENEKEDGVSYISLFRELLSALYTPLKKGILPLKKIWEQFQHGKLLDPPVTQKQMEFEARKAARRLEKIMTANHPIKDSGYKSYLTPDIEINLEEKRKHLPFKKPFAVDPVPDTKILIPKSSTWIRPPQKNQVN